MRRRLSNEFFMNYLMVFLLSLLAAVFAFLILNFADNIISKTLVKNIYTANSIMQYDYAKIDASPVIQNSGGIQIIDKEYRVVYSQGMDTIKKQQLTAAEFTDFLTNSKSKGIPYNYDIAFNPKGEFWLVVTFPTSIRLDFSIVYNREAVSKDMKNVAAAFTLVFLFYLFLLAVFAAVYSRVTAVQITKPLRKLIEGTRLLKEGDYSARIDLRLKNEFAELQDTFNDMAERIGREMALRKQSEEDRRKLILDISHDLKNPLASISGYAELCMENKNLTLKEQGDYLKIIHNNSQRVNKLLMELFELSRLESPQFSIKPVRTDICEYLRQTLGELLPYFEQAGFNYAFDIPDEACYAMVDTVQMSRVFHNLSDNAIRYNPEGTVVSVSLSKGSEEITIVFEDDGIGIPSNVSENIFKPFVRADDSRNSKTGGTGLGLSIAQKIVEAHGGSLTLRPDTKGCSFKITIAAI
ncbi:sensor histidine kinase YycG [Oxobacter pfennigii]|uniref:histidine kinase n=1 Tax=Oxobacter pfennigii TaxID=36849 RepID=A0A0P8WKK3_9CLOT|nr:HAMP domain-containing sensor histidine kinase [Oxobacter pfennigii]KPU42869.1 sensor histidine kinase YycG [Oxobacter pfennigii]